MDFEPWRDENGKTGSWLDPEYVNDQRPAGLCADAQAKPELMDAIKRMIESGDGNLFIKMLDGLEAAEKSFTALSELVESAHSQVLVAGSAYEQEGGRSFQPSQGRRRPANRS